MGKKSIRVRVLMFIVFLSFLAVFWMFEIKDTANKRIGFQKRVEQIEVYGKDDIQNIKTILNSYPENYSSNKAIGKGDYVIVLGQVKDGQNVWDNFCKNIKDKKNSCIVIVQYTNEGDPILGYLSYIYGNFFYMEDNTRDRFRGGDYSSDEYKYLKTFKEKEGTSAVLINDNTVTYEQYKNSMISSDSSDHIPCRPLFYIVN